MSFPLLKQSIKANISLWGIVTVIMNVILAQLLLMDGMSQLVPTMYYGMLCLMMCALYIVIATNNLLAGQVDRGSMAYILSTPIKRSKVVITQLIYLAGSLFVTFSLLTINFLLCNQTLSAQASFATDTIVYMNLGALLVALALSSICFMTSGIFNLSKYSIGSGGMIVVAFLLLALIGSFSNYGVTGLDVFKDLTIVSLYNIGDIIADKGQWVAQLSILGIIAIIGYSVGGIWFTKKDLPL
ncbi:ABC transporter permease subunit [Enterococcus hermanniensis]|uniref:ABC transporter permease n=1 Tax=Enterococcus hermanniensis TaxID=249189 RepID=A0A1L8TQ04_9ENTE|nr:ABC transporter permease subunit [Enterococcus hermanniensis]OJG46258.1 hypothetical protein RV04_GL001424 [Enterococcus hermanniensis]